MGIGSSVPLKNELKRKTFRTSELIQRILGWMLKESNLLDFYALASPTECKKYVMFASDNLDALFKDIQIYPLKDNKGRIYFRKIDELKQMPADLEKKRSENCYHIAYFFIRILQVFAALALSVMDTEIPNSFAILEAQAEKKKDTKYVSPEEFKQLPLFATKQEQKKSFWGGAITAGSRLYIKDQNYSILNKYLTSQGDGYLYLYDDVKTTGIRISEIDLLAGRYVFSYKTTDSAGNPQEIIATLNMVYSAQNGEQKYDARLDKFYLNGKAYHAYIPADIDFTGPTGSDPKYKLQTIPRYIKNQLYRILGKPTEDDASDVKTIKSASNLPKDIDPKFKVPEIWKSIGQQPPIKAYCVARALQLLSPEAIYDTSLKQAARTSICNTKFALIETASLPKPEQSILSSSSLLSLNLLFFDVLENTIPSIKNKEKYRDFLNFMRTLYEERTNLAAKEITNIHRNVEGIQEKTNPVLCDGKSKPLFTKDREVARLLRNQVSQLLDRQVVHTANVVKVLELLFKIEEGKPLVLQPKVQEEGMEEVNRIAEIARNLLVSYYSDCEKIYRDGVIIARDRKNAFQEA